MRDGVQISPAGIPSAQHWLQPRAGRLHACVLNQSRPSQTNSWLVSEPWPSVGQTAAAHPYEYQCQGLSNVARVATFYARELDGKVGEDALGERKALEMGSGKIFLCVPGRSCASRTSFGLSLTNVGPGLMD